MPRKTKDDDLDMAIKAMRAILEDHDAEARHKVQAARVIADLLRTRHRLTDQNEGSFFKRRLND